MHLLVLAGLLLAMLPGPVRPASAETHDSVDWSADPAAWLDDPSLTWNTPGDPITRGPGPPEVLWSPHCERLYRPADSEADRQVEAAGWRLVGPSWTGWGMVLIPAGGPADAMCRPVPFTAFVFVDGVYAGSVTPLPRFPRTDGALEQLSLNADGVHATYVRYAQPYPLCCPSGHMKVLFTVEQTPEGPVIQPALERQTTPARGSPAAPRPAATPVPAQEPQATTRHVKLTG
jgi:hypothetical protein